MALEGGAGSGWVETEGGNRTGAESRGSSVSARGGHGPACRSAAPRPTHRFSHVPTRPALGCELLLI